MAAVNILLTFDDGPHHGPVAANFTMKIVDEMNRRGIAGAFFVQTRAPLRMQHPPSRAATRHAVVSGHAIVIHTGSDLDHRPHWERLRDGKLEEDLRRAIADIEAVTQVPPLLAHTPRFVRATYLEFWPKDATDAEKPRWAARIRQAYANCNLRHVGVNVDSFDSHTVRLNSDKSGACGLLPREKLVEWFGKSVPHVLQKGTRDLVVLFHDIKVLTAGNLDRYIDAISAAVTAVGHTPTYTATRAEAEAMMARMPDPLGGGWSYGAEASWCKPKRREPTSK